MAELAELLRASVQPTRVDMREAVAALVRRSPGACLLSSADAVNDAISSLIYRPVSEHLEWDNSVVEPLERWEREADAHAQTGFDGRRLFIVYDHAFDQESYRRYYELEAQFRVNARATPVPFRMHVIGRRHAFVPVDMDDNAAGAWYLTEPTAVAELRALFVRHWRTARAVRRSGLGAVTLGAVLTDFQAGRTDEAAARRRGVSLRTYRRGVADTLDCLGATTRFQAGVVAARLGLLDLVDDRAAPLA